MSGISNIGITIPNIDCGVYAFLTGSFVTNIPTGNSFVPISGTFDNNPISNFSLGENAIVCHCNAPTYFEIDWHADISSQDAGRTVHVGILKNNDTLTVSSPSVMGTYVKYAGEVVTLSGTTVVYLKNGDTIQLQTTSDTNDDNITFYHFTTTLRKFLQ